MQIILSEDTRRAVIEKAVNALKKGGMVVYPADTVYGIAVDATNAAAIQKLDVLKSRKSGQKYSSNFSDIEMVKEFCEVSKSQEKILNKYLPGPFTFILERKTSNSVAREVALRSNSVGVRIPNCKFTEIVRRAKIPFVTTSVNISGKKYATSIKDIEREIFDRVDIIIENGVLNRRPSILLDYRESIPKIIKR